MNNDKIGTQTIGCSVKSCRHHGENGYCELSRIEVAPCPTLPDDGRPEDESLCASYRTR